MAAAFTLVAAMNPCPCGFRGHQGRPCTCTPLLLARYRSRLSGPLLDRIDLQVEVPALDPSVLRLPPDPAWATARLRDQVAAARARQLVRNRGASGPVPNARLEDRLLARACHPDDAVEDLLEELLRLHRQSGRARVRMLRLARTLADLAGRERIDGDDVLEAAALRGFARELPR
jgi:magnesium chelatase family protein